MSETGDPPPADEGGASIPTGVGADVASFLHDVMQDVVLARWSLEDLAAGGLPDEVAGPVAGARRALDQAVEKLQSWLKEVRRAADSQ